MRQGEIQGRDSGVGEDIKLSGMFAFRMKSIELCVFFLTAETENFFFKLRNRNLGQGSSANSVRITWDKK